MWTLLKACLAFLAFGLVVCAGMWILATAATIATNTSIALGIVILSVGIFSLGGITHGITNLLLRDNTCEKSSSSSSSSDRS